MPGKRKLPPQEDPVLSDAEEEDFEEEEVEQEEEEDQATPAPTAAEVSFDGEYKNKQRVLVFCSRGVTARSRHLLEDLRKLLPHHKKEVKLDTKDDLKSVNEIAEIKSCNSTLFFESRKRQDLYMWASKTPHGPSAKFLVSNVHTMDELRMTGNCMLGSRPLLSFDTVFSSQPHLKLLKAMFTDIFGTPRGHPKSKPFIDRVMSFGMLDGRIWVRNYQIMDAVDGDKKAEKVAAHAGKELTNLVEIGPRFVLTPIRIFNGSFGGPTLYANPKYTSPNATRQAAKTQYGEKYSKRRQANDFRKEKEEINVVPLSDLHDTFS